MYYVQHSSELQDYRSAGPSSVESETLGLIFRISIERSTRWSCKTFRATMHGVGRFILTWIRELKTPLQTMFFGADTDKLSPTAAV